MLNIIHFAWFSAGVGVGIAATVLLVPEAGTQSRGRIRGAAHRAGGVLRGSASNLGDAARDVQNERSHAISALKVKAKEKIDNAAEATKKAMDQTAYKAKNLTHRAGKTITEGGKRLQNA